MIGNYNRLQIGYQFP